MRPEDGAFINICLHTVPAYPPTVLITVRAKATPIPLRRSSAERMVGRLIVGV
jgi:hypothetical protein